jgi:predicted secreted protein
MEIRKMATESSKTCGTDAKITRSRKLLLVSHCVLNQNSVVCGWERAAGAFQFVREIIESGVGIIQLPCPEMEYAGCGRPPQNYEEYNTAPYRELCRRLAESVTGQMKEYLKHGYQYCGIIGIQNSPTCSISGRRGVFMEELLAQLSDIGLVSGCFEVPESYDDGCQGGVLDLIHQIKSEVQK